MGEVTGLIAPISDAVSDEIDQLSDAQFPTVKGFVEDYRTVDPSVVFSSTLEALHDGIERSSR